jgi:sialic acid synthase SpsE
LIGEPRDAAVLAEEELTAAAARRSAVVARDLPAGHVLTAEDVRFLRPSGPVGAATPVAGRTLHRARRSGERLDADDLG